MQTWVVMWCRCFRCDIQPSCLILVWELHSLKPFVRGSGKIIRHSLSIFDAFYYNRCIRKAASIVDDPSQASHGLFFPSCYMEEGTMLSPSPDFIEEEEYSVYCCLQNSPGLVELSISHPIIITWAVIIHYFTPLYALRLSVSLVGSSNG